MSCNIFKKPLSADVKNNDNISFDLTWLSELIPSYNVNNSGIWQPLWVSYTASKTSGAQPLYPARSAAVKSFSPCDCQDAQINPKPLYQEESIIGLCNYCGSPPTGILWKLYDDSGASSPRSYTTTCCSGGCDVMLKVDDYIPKIPYLNSAYISGLADWKHKKQFPASNNKPLGCESFISVADSELATIKGASVKVDWRIQETISEIPYDRFSSYHDSQHMHEMAYKQSQLTSSTCGNFIMVSLPSNADTGNFYSNEYPILRNLIFSSISGDTPDNQIPAPRDFIKPYGFDQETYKNIFIHKEKIGSYWKWNYTSGILCWYRYYNSGIPDDTRPLPGIDLYISPGDVFFANNDGPEPATDLVNPTGMVGLIKSCPSGLKLLKGSTVTGIVPSGSQFAYISANIYDKFYTTYRKLLEILPTGDDIAQRSFKAAMELATAPQYDEIIVDLFKRHNSYSYAINQYGQIDLLNKYMQSGTTFDSVSNLNYISNKKELFDTLNSKYGAYLWIPPNTDTKITFASSIDTTFAVDLNFNLSIIENTNNWANTTCSPFTSCGSRSLAKSFSYEQNIGYGQGQISTKTNEDLRYSNTCISGSLSDSNYGFYSNIYYNSSLIKSVFSSSGCSTLLDIYPRIAQDDTSTFCTDCDPYSSFYLINNAETVECGNFNSTNSFCYSTLAKRFNNSPKQFPTDEQNRVERALADGTKRWKRSYNAIFFNPYIDSVAFHQNNGVFINSVPFKLDKFTAFELSSSTPAAESSIYVRFKTKDLGIKIYELGAEYLQTSSSSTYGCKRFPVNKTCQCLPIISQDTIVRPIKCDDSTPTSFQSSNIFTPGLSTRYAPKLKKYGGFSQQYLDSIFGADKLTAGGTIPILTSYSNPISPVGCNSTASITLYNYTNSEWNISLQGKSPDSDISATINEDINLLGPRYIFTIYRDEGREDQVTNFYTDYDPVLSSKRFATKVSINDIEAYNGQTITLSNPGNVMTIKLKNPFLSAAMAAAGGDENAVLYPPSGNLQRSYVFENNKTTSVGDTQRGDETSAVTITFSQKFKSHKLLYKISPLESMGSLTNGFFDPNNGLTTSITDKSPISGGILYSHELDPEQDWPPGKVYYGDITQRVLNSIRSLNDFDTNKKLRLYIQQNGKWYKYTPPNSGSFTINDIEYPGTPTFFEYNQETNTNNLPAVLLTPVRKHIDFDFIRNNNWSGSLPRYESTTPFPLSRNICTRSSSNNTEIHIPGIRSYFLIPEKDPAINTNLDSIEDISSFSAPSSLKYGSTIVFNNKQHWICINPKVPTSRSSYIYSEFSYLHQYFSDTHIKYKANLQGYIYNTKKSGEYPITLYFGPNLSSSTNTILEKSIYVSFKTKNGGNVTSFSTEDVYVQPYTVLKLKDTIPTDVRAFNLYPPTGASLILTQVTAPISEYDPLLINNYLPSKWGDVVGYGGELVDASIDAQYQIDKIYPKSTYNNLFQQMIINNHSKNHIYKISGYGSSSTDIVTGMRDNGSQSIYYCILQKYGIGDNTQTYSIYADRYHNYIPLIDLNLINLEVQSTPISGKINVGNVTKSTKPSDGYEPYNAGGKFWINFPSGATVEGTFVPTSDFYSETLRIDTPLFWLNNTTQKTKIIDSGVTCRAEFGPNGVSSYNAGLLFDNSTSCTIISTGRNQPFWTYPIYCDRDDNTCDNSGCFGSGDHGLTRKADFELFANYKIATPTTGLLSSPMGFAFGYDAGVYNVIGNDSLIEIKRFALQPNNLIDTYNDSCSSSFILPSNYRVGSSSPVFQNTINDTSISTPITSYTIDEAANEMLFRILYGQSQYVNRKMYFIDNEIYNKQDVIGYTDPRIKAENIYSQILYNYDKAASSNFNLNGSFTVNGVISVGSSTTIDINDWSATITIENRPATGIYAVAVMNDGSKLESLIYRTTITNLEYVIQDVRGVGEPPIMPDPDPPPPSPPDANTSLQFVGECLYYDSYKYWQVAFQYEQDKFPAQPYEKAEQSSSCGISWAGAAGEASMGQGGICCCGSFTCGGGCVLGSITRWGPTNLRQFVCGQAQLGRVGFVAPITREPVIPCNGLGYAYGINSGPCTQFDLGYCRKKDCPKCNETLQSETENNFTYSWQNCRTTFSLYGHIYRQVHSYEYNPVIVQPRPPDCYTSVNSNNGADVCGNIPPGTPPPTNSSITTCTTYPVMGLTRDQMDELVRNNMLIDIIPGTRYTCPSQTNGYAAPIAYTSCITVYGKGSACSGNDAFEKSCLWQGCSPDPLGVPDVNGVCQPNVSAGKGCKFCYTPESSFTMINNDIDDGFEYPTGKCSDYCHYCAIGRRGSHNINFKKKVFLKTSTINSVPYNPLCATTLCTVSYSNSAITLTINGKSKCFSQTINSCPKINISSTMNQLSVSDNVESNCDECLSSALKVFVPEQKKTFVTKRERRRCLLATFASCGINNNGLVTGGRQAFEWHMSWALQCGGGSPQYGCGKLGGMVYNNSDLSFDVTYECLKGLPCSMTHKLAAYEVPETIWRLNTQLKGRYAYLGKGSNHIPVEDIIEGVVPGSVSSVQQESYIEKEGVAITRDGTITNNVSTVYAFYYTYDYIRPITMQDVLRNDSSIMCTSNFFEIRNDNTYHQCSALPFPSQYASNLDIAAAYRFNIGKTGFLEGVSYTNIHPIYYQQSNCDGAISCYYKHRVFICGAGDFCCMGDLGVIRNEGIESTCGEAQIPFREELL